MADPLEQLYVEHKEAIYRFLFRSTLNAHLAEELTQETFIKAFKGIHKFRRESSLKTWLFKIARNTYINEMKKRSNQLEQHVDIASIPIKDKQNDYTALEEQMIIRFVLHQMEDKERTLILLRDFQEFTYVDIAEILNVTEGQVKIGIYRARKKFRRLYQEQDEGGS